MLSIRASKPGDGPFYIAVNDATVLEGNAGTVNVVLTVTGGGGGGACSF